MKKYIFAAWMLLTSSAFAVETQTINFGSIPRGTSLSIKYHITNNKNYDQNLERLQLLPSDYFVANYCPFTVTPQETCLIHLTMFCWNEGPNEGSLIYIFDNKVHKVKLQGYCTAEN